MRLRFSLRAVLICVAIGASFIAFIGSWFGNSLSVFDLLPLVVGVTLVTCSILTRACRRGRSSALGLIGIGAVAASSTTCLFVIAAAIVWSAPVYADDSKGFLISPEIIVFYLLGRFASIAGVGGASVGFVYFLCEKLRKINSR